MWKCGNVDSYNYNKMCVYLGKMRIYVKHFRFSENLFKCIGVASYYSRSSTVLFSSVSFLPYLVVYLTLPSTWLTWELQAAYISLWVQMEFGRVHTSINKI
jgi:hypothetical protein